MSQESGFTLIEIIVSLVIAGILVAVAGMGLTTATRGYVFARENAHMAQKSQLALARLNREFMEMLDVVTPTSSSIIYELTRGNRAVAQVGNTLKTRDGSALPDALNGDILVDGVNSFTLSYFKGSQTWVPGTDDVPLLSALRIDLVLDRADSGIGTVTFSTTVHPRNTKNYGGAAPTTSPPTLGDYGCFVSTAAGRVPLGGTVHGENRTAAMRVLPLLGVVLLFAAALQTTGAPRGRSRRGASRERGSILISLIATMVILSVLGAAMLPLTSTSTFSQVGANSASRAYLLAESAYRYAAGEFLNAGDRDQRDAMLTTLSGQTYRLADNEGQFHLEVSSHWFKTTADPVGSQSLSTTVPGGLPSGMNLNQGYLQVDGAVHLYTSVVVSPPSVIFTKSDNWASIPVGTVVSNVARSQSGAQTVTRNGDLVLRENNLGANAFPLRNGQFRVNGDLYSYRELDLPNDRLKGITDPDDPNMPDLVVPGSSWIILEDFIKVRCTGTFAPGSGMETSRTISYSTPLGWVARVEGAQGRTEVTDSFADLSNWQPSTQGSHAVALEDGSNALDVTETTALPAADTSLIEFDWASTAADLAAAWEYADYHLSYDAQTKIKIANRRYFFAGVNFRMSGSDTYGLSLLRASPDADDRVPADLVPVTDQLAVLLWEATGGGTSLRWLAYKPLSSSDYVLSENTYFADDMESGPGAWDPGTGNPWALTEEDSHSATHSWTDSPGGNYPSKVTARLEITDLDLTAATHATLSIWHKLDLAWDKDSAKIELRYRDKKRDKWVTLATYTSDVSGWQKETFDISGYLPGMIGIGFELKSAKQSPGADGWHIDDVTISCESLDWPSLLVRVQEKVADSGRFSGQKVNDIRAYIADVNPHGSPGTDPLDNNRKAHPRDQVNWPPDDVDDTSAANDTFTLIQWDPNLDASVDRIGTGNELNAVIRSNSLTTPSSGAFTQSELALHTFGSSSADVFFDDFAVRLENSSGGEMGFLPPVQQ